MTAPKLSLRITNGTARCGQPGCPRQVGIIKEGLIRLDHEHWSWSPDAHEWHFSGRTIRPTVYPGATGPILVPSPLTSNMDPGDVIVCPRCGTRQTAPTI